jgi:hypothetical protein
MIVDLFLVYHFIKRLATPFNEWKAYEQGIIDEKGNILKKTKELRTVAERDAWGKFDLMILKLKRLLEKVPGGSSRIASYAAALYLIKEHSNIDAETITEEELTESFNQYMMIAEENTTDVDALFESKFEEEIANTAGSGSIAGIGVGKDGEPGFDKQAMQKYKNKNKILRRFKDKIDGSTKSAK